jgi:predicted cupin superfamily sugar epimerase
MSPRARQLLETLGLEPHPEGGFFRQVHRSPTSDGARPASTAIYFLLAAGQKSRWHRVDAEEAWHHYEGGPLELLWTSGEDEVRRLVLGPVDVEGARPLAVLPAGVWQAARPLGEYALVGCTVAPGFEYAGFSLLAVDAAAAARFAARHPRYAELL